MFVKSGNLMGEELISLYLDKIIAESSNFNLPFSIDIRRTTNSTEIDTSFNFTSDLFVEE